MRRSLIVLASAGIVGLLPVTGTLADGELAFSGTFAVAPQSGRIGWTGWAGEQHYPGDRDVLVTVDRDAVVPFEFEQTVHTDAEGRWETFFAGLQPGDVVRTDTAPNSGTVEDTQSREHTVYALTIDGWDEATDRVWGSSDVGVQGLQVCVGTSEHSWCMNQWFPEGDPDPWEGDTTWEYQFPDTYVAPGANIGATELDVDGDYTEVFAQVPGPPLPDVTLNAYPTTALWDGASVGVRVTGFEPGTQALLTINVAADPTGKFQFLPNVPIGGDGTGTTMVSLPRYVAGVDCAPDACMLVTADPADPFGRNATVPLTFGLVELFRYSLDDQDDPGAGGIVGDPIVAAVDTVNHGEFIWVEGTGFQPNQQYQLNQCKGDDSPTCRNTWWSMPWAYTDGEGTFGQTVQVGKVMYGPWGTSPQWSISPAWDLRDGTTVMVEASGLPTSWSISDWPLTWIGVRAPGMSMTPSWRSDQLTFSPGDVRLNVHIGQAREQQLAGIVHFDPLESTDRTAQWDWSTGDMTYGYTAIQRWLPYDPANPGGAFDPLPVEDGYYDCADQLPYGTTTSGAQESVHCSMYMSVDETVVDTGEVLGAHGAWIATHFARFDLTAEASTAVLSSKPAGVSLRGEVSCTGFSPEQYLVNIEGVLTQTTTGKRPVTITSPFVVTVTCSGTMANPGTAYWTVFVPGAFKAGTATVTLDVSSAGFTRNDDPLHVSQTVTITAPPKGKK
jgi:hypothetical protein